MSKSHYRKLLLFLFASEKSIEHKNLALLFFPKKKKKKLLVNTPLILHLNVNDKILFWLDYNKRVRRYNHKVLTSIIYNIFLETLLCNI